METTKTVSPGRRSFPLTGPKLDGKGRDSGQAKPWLYRGGLTQSELGRGIGYSLIDNYRVKEFIT
jgi:hypothetical protein